MSGRQPLRDASNSAPSKSRSQLLADWKAKRPASTDAGSILLKRGLSSTGSMMSGGVSRVAGGAVRNSAAVDTKRQKTANPPITSTARSRVGVSRMSMGGSARFSMNPEQPVVDERERKICFAEGPPSTSDDGACAGGAPMKSALKGASRTSTTTSSMTTSSNDAVQRAMMRRTAAPAVQSGGVEEEEEEVEVEVMEDIDLVESAGLKSRLKAMQKKIGALEDQKMKLSMAKAPLETRLRQGQDNLEAMKAKMEGEMDGLQKALKLADEKYRKLELKSQGLKEENTKLSFEVRKANSTVSDVKHSDDSAWSRQLSNDSEIEELKEKMEEAAEEIQGLKLDKVSLESDVHGQEMELNALGKELEEQRGKSDEIEEALTKASEAEIRLEVLTREHVATSAQLNAVSQDFAATKSSSEAAMEQEKGERKESEKQVRDAKSDRRPVVTRPLCYCSHICLAASI